MALRIKTDNLSTSVIRDALSVAFGMYRMNAWTAVGYGFDPDEGMKEVGYGAFLFTSDDPYEFTGVVHFEARTVKDMITGETLPIERFMA
jgi:sorbitol-specific phosphotransferase system component IIA